MFKDLRNIIYDQKFKITILENKVDINNYQEILVFEENQILVTANNCVINIKGQNLTISRLLEHELLIEGKIKTIEFG